MPSYNNAIQNPEICFSDPELKQGMLWCDRRNRPLLWSGNFAYVYRMVCDNGDYAVRCFTRSIKGQQERYRLLQDFLERSDLPEFVNFEYQEAGILAEGEWWPIVKMEWVEGQTLYQFADAYIRGASNGIATWLAHQWREIDQRLRELEIAHNDLQHGNIIIKRDGSIRLVDYDPIFLPPFKGQQSPEIGHPNYQHPHRNEWDYGAHIDNFPSIVIYLTLMAIGHDPALWRKFNRGDDKRLLFSKDDFDNPEGSVLFQELAASRDRHVADMARKLMEYCRLPVGQVPELASAIKSQPAAKFPHELSYREVLRERQAAHTPQTHIWIDETPATTYAAPAQMSGSRFLKFCVENHGADLKMLNSSRTFNLVAVRTASAIYARDNSPRGFREIKTGEILRFLKFFEESQSWNASDYTGRPLFMDFLSAAYCLAILRDCLMRG